jgi:hypothetical protein
MRVIPQITLTYTPEPQRPHRPLSSIGEGRSPAPTCIVKGVSNVDLSLGHIGQNILKVDLTYL